MDIIKCEMTIETYDLLPDEIKKRIVVIDCHPEDFDYSFSEECKRLKKEFIKLYKRLKNFEYELRNGNNK